VRLIEWQGVALLNLIPRFHSGAMNMWWNSPQQKGPSLRDTFSSNMYTNYRPPMSTKMGVQIEWLGGILCTEKNYTPWCCYL